MKHIQTSQTAFNKIKAAAKQLRTQSKIPLSEAQEIVARQAGYENFHHLTECVKKSKQDKPVLPDTETPKTQLLNYVELSFYEPHHSMRFESKDPDKLNRVTDELDSLVERLDSVSGNMTTISEAGLQQIVEKCKRLTREYPGYIDGYAHMVGALLAQGKHLEAVLHGLYELYDGFILLAPKVEEGYELSYYELNNRPYFRLAHNVVLALQGVGIDDVANDVIDNMLTMWPNDNVGFRFLKKG